MFKLVCNLLELKLKYLYHHNSIYIQYTWHICSTNHRHQTWCIWQGCDTLLIIVCRWRHWTLQKLWSDCKTLPNICLDHHLSLKKGNIDLCIQWIWRYRMHEWREESQNSKRSLSNYAISIYELFVLNNINPLEMI